MLNNFSNMKKTVVFDGIIIGIGAGLVSVTYRYALSYMEKICHLIYSQPLTKSYILILIALLTFMGLIVGLLVKFAPLSSGSGIPQVQGELMGVFNMDEKKTIISKFIGGSLAAIGGLSLGREGPSIQLGAASGKLISKFLRRDQNEQKYLISAGASAGLAAAFSAPISGTIFILEEMYKNFSHLVLVPAIIASVIADFMSKYVFGLSPAFSFSVQNPLSLHEYSHIIFLGIIIGLIGVSFNKTLLFIQSLYKKLPVKNEFKPIIAFLTAGIFGYTFPYVLGGGHHVLEDLVKSRVSVELLIAILVLNLIFTCISYGSTAQGGIFLPILVIGAIGGGIYYNVVKYFGFIGGNDYFVNFVILAMAGMLSSVVRSPIISIMLVTEMTGSFEHILSLCVITITAYLVAEICRCKPIYESLLERMLDSSLTQNTEGEYIDEKVLYQLIVSHNSKLSNMKIKEIDMPFNSLIVSIKRLDEEIIPKGNTLIKSGDTVTILTDNKNLKDLIKHLENV